MISDDVPLDGLDEFITSNLRADSAHAGEVLEAMEQIRDRLAESKLTVVVSSDAVRDQLCAAAAERGIGGMLDVVANPAMVDEGKAFVFPKPSYQPRTRALGFFD